MTENIDYQHPNYMAGWIHALEIVVHGLLRGKFATIPAVEAIEPLVASSDMQRPHAGDKLFHLGFTDTISKLRED